MTEKGEAQPKKTFEDYGPDDMFIGMDEGPEGGIDMTGEPWWKRFWFKLLRIT